MPPAPEPVCLARHAMATRFELVLHGDNPTGLRAAGEEALAEIEALEARLSLYRPDSEIAGLNARAAREPVRVSPLLFRLLEHARRLAAETGGAFDITLAPLVRAWGFMGGTGSPPDPDDLAAARSVTGWHLVDLDPASCAVRFLKPGVMLDLGAIGKGFAIERAAGLLRDAGVTSALLHGGTSTVQTLGAPPGESAWSVAIDLPPEGESPGRRLAVVALRDESLSVSAVWGRAFRAGPKILGHIIDGRTGAPADRAVLSAFVSGSATESDALSTALLTLGPDGHELIASLRSGTRTLVIQREAGGALTVAARGITPVSGGPESASACTSMTVA